MEVVVKKEYVYQVMGENIARLRKEWGLSRKEFAARVGRTPQTVGRWERGEVIFYLSHLELLTETFGISVLELIRGLKK